MNLSQVQVLVGAGGWDLNGGTTLEYAANGNTRGSGSSLGGYGLQMCQVGGTLAFAQNLCGKTLEISTSPQLGKFEVHTTQGASRPPSIPICSISQGGSPLQLPAPSSYQILDFKRFQKVLNIWFSTLWKVNFFYGATLVIPHQTPQLGASLGKCWANFKKKF